MTLWFETHATSVDNEAQLASGWVDVPLSPLGEQQARELGARRRQSDLHAVYCSDLRRAHDTARIAFSGSNLSIIVDRRLRECDYGEMTQKPSAEVDAMRLRAVRTPFPQGESYEGTTQRHAEFLQDALARWGDAATILVIGHRATFYALEHLCRGRILPDVIAAAWHWQPGWRYDYPIGAPRLSG